MTVKFEYWQSEEDGQWFFHLKTGSGGIVVQSVGYSSEDECLDAIDFVRFYADIALIVQPDVTTIV